MNVSPAHSSVAERSAGEHRVAKAHSLLGIVPLASVAIVHLWQLSAGIEGRDAFEQRMNIPALGVVWVTVGLLGVAFGAHVVLGYIRLRGGAVRSQECRVARGNAQLAWGAGFVAVCCAAVHVNIIWPALVLRDPLMLYGILRSDAANYVLLATYLIGVGAFSLHLSESVLDFATTWEIVTRPATFRWVRLAATLGAAAFFIISVNTLSHYVAGRALFFGGGG